MTSLVARPASYVDLPLACHDGRFAWGRQPAGNVLRVMTWVAGVLFALVGNLTAQERDVPFLEKIPVFVAETHGYGMYRIPGIVVSPQGSVLVYGEARKKGGDWDEIRLVLRRSTDGGQTWGPQRTIGELQEKLSRNPVVLKGKNPAPDRITYNNIVAIPDRETGAIHIVYCIEYMRCFYLRSDDDGLTFSEPVEITKAFDEFRPEYQWRVLATGPGHGIQLRTGRLVIPVWLSTADGKGAHHPSVTATIYSDDQGQSWKRGEIAVPSTEEFVDPNETCLAELSDGRVLLNVRNESPRQRRLVVVSPDGAGDWSKPEFHEELAEPVCMASLLKVAPREGKNSLLLFTNPDSPLRTRKNLTVRLSLDDGKTWPVSRTLDAGPSAYSDLAELPDGTFLCAYEMNESPRAIVVARFNMAWLKEGESATSKTERH